MRLTTKLRLGALSLVGAALAAAGLSAWALQSIGADRQRLTDESLPRMLLLSQLDETIFGLLAQAPKVTEVDRLAERGDETLELVASGRRFAAGVQSILPQLPEDLAERLRQDAARVSEDLDALVFSRALVLERRLAANAAMTALTEEILPLRGALLEWRERVRRSGADADGPQQMAAQAAAFQRLVSAASALDDMLAVIERARGAKDEAAVRGIRSLLALQMRDLVQLVALLPADPVRRDVMAGLASQRARLLDDRLLAPLQAVAAERAVFSGLAWKLIDRLAASRATVGAALADLRMDLEERGAELAERTRASYRLIGLLALLVTVLGAAIVFVQIEFQVARRLRAVDDGLRRIGEGELGGGAPPVGGDDEIARIDDAVERLRRGILERRELERELALRTEEAERHAAAKTEFLSMMSHEVRTPLNAIMGLFELIERAEVPERQRRRAAHGRQAAEGLDDVLSKVLDASRIEAGLLTIDPRETQLDGVLAYAADCLEGGPDGAPPGVSVQVIRKGDLPESLEVDEARLRQILSNLIDNALRFTEHGAVELVVRTPSEPLGAIAFTVRDTGPGIPADQQDGVFDLFRQVEGGIAGGRGGSGLGLAISRALAELMGGSLTLRSVEGEGTEVTLLLPVRGNAARERAA